MKKDGNFFVNNLCQTKVKPCNLQRIILFPNIKKNTQNK